MSDPNVAPQQGGTPEQMPADALSGLLTASDATWLATFGCLRPADVSEADWLATMNGFIPLGSTHITPATPETEQAQIVAARVAFYDSLMNLGSRARQQIIGTHAMPNLVPLDTFIGAQRLLFINGIDGARIIRYFPAVLLQEAPSLDHKLQILRDAGLDVAATANAVPHLFTWSAENISGRITALRGYGFTTADMNDQPTLLDIDRANLERRFGGASPRVLSLLRTHPQWLDLPPAEVARLLPVRAQATRAVDDRIAYSAEVVRHSIDVMRARVTQLRGLGFTDEASVYRLASLPIYAVDDISSRLVELAAYGIDSLDALGHEPRLTGIPSDELANRVQTLRSLGYDVPQLVGLRPDVLTLPSVIIHQRTDYLRGVGIADVPRAAIVHSRLLNYPLPTLQAKVRALQTHGVDVADAVRRNANILGVPADEVGVRMGYLAALGFDAPRMISTLPMVLGLTPRKISRMIRLCTAIAEAWGLDDPQAQVRQTVQEWPQILTYSPHRLAMIARVTSAALASSYTETGPIQTSLISRIVTLPPEKLLAAYFLHRHEMHTVQDVHRLATNAQRHDSAELMRLAGLVLEESPSDPVARRYQRT